MEETMKENMNMDSNEVETKGSSSVYDKIYPMRMPMMAIGGIVFLIGLGMFVGGFAGLVADMDVKLRRTGAPNIGYLLMLIVSVVVMVAGGVSLFCGCGAIRYRRRMDSLEARKKMYKEQKTPDGELRPRTAPAFTSSQTRILEPNGDVTYTVTYQYRGPPPAKINGIPAYPAPPPGVNPVLKIDPSKPAVSRKTKKKITTAEKQSATPGSRGGRENDLSLVNVPRKLVLGDERQLLLGASMSTPF